MIDTPLRSLLVAIARPLGWVVVFSFFLNVSYLAAPLYMMQVYDRVMRSQSVPTLLYLTILVAMAYLVVAIMEVTRGQILTSLSDIVEHKLAVRLMSSVVVAHEHDTDRPGSTQITRDLDTVRQFAAGSGILAFVDIPWAPIYLIVLFVLNVNLGFFATIVCIILVGLSIAGERLARAPMARANALAVHSQHFGDAVVRGAHCVSTMGLGIGVTARWKTLRLSMLAEQALATEYTILIAGFAKFIRLFTQSAILGLGAYLTIHHQLSGGAIFAGSLLLGRCLAPVESVIGSWRATINARLALRRILATVGNAESQYVSLPSPLGELMLDQVSWCPAGTDRPALVNVNMKVNAGAVLAIIGPNAAGKSTLGRILTGSMRPSMGTVRLDGAELQTWSPTQLGQAIGYLPQDPTLLPGTIKDNIARFTDATDAEIIAAAQAALAHEMIMRLPSGYQTRVDEAPSELSGGQRQRIALARALLFDPAVLVLDEPSASLDADGEAALMTCVAKARERHRTVVLITHSAALVRLADYVATMVNGRLLRVQRATELLSRPVVAATVA